MTVVDWERVACAERARAERAEAELADARALYMETEERRARDLSALDRAMERAEKAEAERDEARAELGRLRALHADWRRKADDAEKHGGKDRCAEASDAAAVMLAALGVDTRDLYRETEERRSRDLSRLDDAEAEAERYREAMDRLRVKVDEVADLAHRWIWTRPLDVCAEIESIRAMLDSPIRPANGSEPQDG